MSRTVNPTIFVDSSESIKISPLKAILDERIAAIDEENPGTDVTLVLLYGESNPDLVEALITYAGTFESGLKFLILDDQPDDDTLACASEAGIEIYTVSEFLSDHALASGRTSNWLYSSETDSLDWIAEMFFALPGDFNLVDLSDNETQYDGRIFLIDLSENLSIEGGEQAEEEEEDEGDEFHGAEIGSTETDLPLTVYAALDALIAAVVDEVTKRLQTAVSEAVEGSQKARQRGARSGVRR